MSRLHILISSVLCLCISTVGWAQAQAPDQVQPMILAPGTVTMQQPSVNLSTDALVYVQVNSLGKLLSDIDGLAMSGLPLELLPEHIKPQLESPNPGMAMLGVMTMGMPLNPMMLEQMLGLDFSAPAGFAFYPSQGQPDFALFLPVKNHLSASGLLMNMIKPWNVNKIDQEGHQLFQVESGNPSLPPRLYIASLQNGILISSNATLCLRVLSYQGDGDPYITKQIAKITPDSDLSIVINTKPLMPMVDMLPRLRPQIDRSLDMMIQQANREIKPQQRVQFNNQLRWRFGITDINQVMYFGKSFTMGSFDTLLDELTIGLQQTRGLLLSIDLSPTHQTLVCDIDSDRHDKSALAQPIDMTKVKTALKELDLPWSQISVTGKQNKPGKSKLLVKWLTNIRNELVRHKVSTLLMDTCLDVYQKQHSPRQFEQLSDWTINSLLTYTPEQTPTQYPTLHAFFKSYDGLQNQPLHTSMRVMPRISDDVLDAHLQASADEKTSDYQASTDAWLALFEGARPQLSHSYSVLKNKISDQMNLYVQQTHIKSAFGLFGFNQHELISRRYLLASHTDSYTLLHDGTSTTSRLNHVLQSQTQVLDPVLEQILDGLPQGVSSFQCSRTLQSLPELLKYAGQIELLIHNEMNAYLQKIDKSIKTPGLSDAEINQMVAAIEDVPLLYQSIRFNTQTKELYATLPMGLAFPRPRVYPVINSLMADFTKYADQEGGLVYSSRMQGTEYQVRMTQDTRLLGRLIKSLGDAVAKRYLHAEDPMAKVTEDFIAPLDGNDQFQEVYYNLMWEFLLSDPQIERGFWDAMSEGLPLGQAKPKNNHRVVDVYFMDTADGSIYVDKSDQLPPVTAPSGKDGVRAFVFSCGDCGDESSRFVGWLETYTHEAKKAIMTPVAADNGVDNYELIENGHMVADPASKKWVKVNSEAGFKIMDQIQNKCGNNAPKPCFPGR
ncbi:MAG TPA: hypothetical protein DER01_07745 [Phycisphaerales bacterium]|nr:hypothetical protein [Phycisphaerales bacterium]